MLTRIVQPSPALESFLDALCLPLSRPQRDHLLDLADSLLVCDESKTLAALQRQFLDSTDPSNWADFLRISPWSAADVRNGPASSSSRMARGRPNDGVCPRSSTSTSMTPSAKRTSRLRTWSPLTGSTITTNPPRASPATTRPFATWNAPCAGDLTATVDLRLYLRDKTVRRLNRHRSPERRLHFRSKFRLARDILESLKPLLPAGWTISVQFDSWYASEGLIKYIHRQGWHAVCALKSNRKLLWATPPSVRSHLTAQAVHARARDRCGREHDDVLRAGRRGPAVGPSL